MKMLFLCLLSQKAVVQRQCTVYSDSTTNAVSSLGKYRVEHWNTKAPTSEDIS